MIYKLKKQYRLSKYDYTGNGYYFVTICIKDQKCWLGKVVEGEMKLSRVGEIVKDEWLKTPKIRKYVRLDEWVIMPNHIHGIIVIENHIRRNEADNNRNLICQIPRRYAPRRVPTMRMNAIHPLNKNSLSSIINQFKGSVKRWCNKNGHSYFAWQPRFYDHVIRNEKSLNEIREYIQNNPKKWELDRENPENLSVDSV